MNFENKLSESSNTVNLMYIIALFLGIISLIIFLSRLNDNKIPIISSDRDATFAIGILGFTMCVMIMKYGLEFHGWMNPLIIVSSVIGLLILILYVLVLFNIQGSFNLDDRQTLVIAFTLISLKTIIATSQRILDVLGILS